MVRVESNASLTNGASAPPFTLPEPLTGRSVSLADVRGSKATVVMVICNHCPFVVLLKQGIVQLAKDYMDKGVGVVAISSNSAQTHPQDGPEQMAADAKQQGYPFPYLYDESQEVAKAYFAMCTPEFYVFDADLKLAYHGRFDEARPGQDKPVTGSDLRSALDAVLSGSPVPEGKPSMGCSIKWSPGNTPDYF